MAAIWNIHLSAYPFCYLGAAADAVLARIHGIKEADDRALPPTRRRGPNGRAAAATEHAQRRLVFFFATDRGAVSTQQCSLHA